MAWISLDNPTREEERALVKEFKKKARFFVDEGLGDGVAELLSEAGWNTVYAKNVGLGGHADEDIFAFAWREQRILLTHDDDFWDDQKFPFHRNPGVVILPDAGDRALVRALGWTLSLVGKFADLYWQSKIKVFPDGYLVIREFSKVEGKHTTSRYRFGKHRAEMWEDD